MSLIIAIPRERRPSERRVALDPSRVERLLDNGMQVRIEADCGHSASFHDEDYHDVTVVDSFAEVVRGADIVVKVVCPTLQEIAHLPSGSILICMVSAFQHVAELVALRDGNVTVLAMDHLPRITRAQPMDALSSQATVAGYKAALLAAELSPRLFPMLTTAAGTIRPSRVLVIGAGVAGLQAIATSKRLGAQVDAYDIRRAAKEQIESVGARMIDTGVEVEGAGGIARALRKDEIQKQHDALAKHVARAHVVICAASLPGRPAPVIITEDMVDGMMPESVLVDLAAPAGGNCEVTRIGEHYYHHETLVVGPLNLASHGSVHASEMYARNIHNMLKLIIQGDEVVLDSEDEIIARCVLMQGGVVHDAATAKLLDVDATQFGDNELDESSELPNPTAGWLETEENQTPGTVAASGDDSDHGVHRHQQMLGMAADSTDLLLRRDMPAGGSDSRNRTNASRETLKQSKLSEDGQRLSAKRAPADPDFSSEEELQVLDGQQDEQDLRDLALLDGANPEGAENDDDADEASVLRDDLTLVDGVGPALQERLYSFGYHRWQQLAELDKEQSELLSVQLELGNEVLEQDWPGQAKRLMEKSE